MRIIDNIVLSDYAEQTIYSGKKFTGFGLGIGFYFSLGIDHRGNLSMFIYTKQSDIFIQENLLNWYETKRSTSVNILCKGMVFIMNDQKGRKEINIHIMPYPHEQENTIRTILEKAWVGYAINFKQNKGTRAPNDSSVPHGI